MANENINWSKIKECIVLYCRNTFQEQGIAIPDNEIKEYVDIFYNVCTINTNYGQLNGVGKELLPALQQLCCENMGSLKDFRTLKTLLDAFLKRILLFSKKASYNEIEGLGTKDLFIKTNVIPSYTKQAPKLTKQIVDSYQRDPTGLYLFAISAYNRNEVHESPDLDPSAITYATKHIIAFYIFMIAKTKTILLPSKPELLTRNFYKINDDRGERMFYNFMNYGQAANALKNRIINSYIYHLLYQKDLNLTDLIEKMIKFTKSSLSKQSAYRLIERLSTNGRINIRANNVSLSDTEQERLNQAYNNYAERINDINNQFDLLIQQFSLKCKRDDLFQVVKSFFENNFTTDLIEIDENISIENKDNWAELKEKLEEFGCTEENCKKVGSAILQICKNNDILIRLGIGKLFSKISNPDTFDAYAARNNRVVYLDTQILLYALCVNMDLGSSENQKFTSVKNLLNSCGNDVDLVFCKHYISEISYHLRQALLLIPFADRYNEIKQKISTNVFYQYYYELRDKDQLPDEIDSFADFLNKEFNVEECDAYSTEYHYISEGIIENLIYDLNIDIEEVPPFSNEQIAKASEVFINSCRKGRIKTGGILKNDAIMGHHLFNLPPDEPEPFFLTWDETFSGFRKKYIERYKRTKLLYWHLFSPSRFVNHLDLLNFKVDANNISDDLISLIEDNEHKEHTANVIDKFNKCLDIEGIDIIKRRKYINLIFDDKDFLNETEGELSDGSKTAELFDRVLNHYREAGTESLKKYTAHILNEDFFKELLSIIKSNIKQEINDEIVSSSIKCIEEVSLKIFDTNE